MREPKFERSDSVPERVRQERTESIKISTKQSIGEQTDLIFPGSRALRDGLKTTYWWLRRVVGKCERAGARLAN